MAQTIDAQVTLARQFERKAAEDARFLASVLPSIDASDTQVGNIAQQAVEKTLKAVLAHRGMNYQVNRKFKTHKIEALVDLLRDLGVDVSADVAQAYILTPFSEGLRYEDDIPETDQLDRKQVAFLVAEVMEFARRELGPNFFQPVAVIHEQAETQRCQWPGCNERITDRLAIQTGYGSSHRRMALSGRSIYLPKG